MCFTILHLDEETVVPPFSASWTLIFGQTFNCLVYINDLLVFSDTPDEHEQHLRTKLQANGLIVRLFGAINLQINHTYNAKHTIYKRQEIKTKKETRNIKRKKEMEVATMSFIKSRGNIRSSCLAYLLFMQSTR